MNGGGAEHPRSEGWSFPCLFCGTQVTRVVGPKTAGKSPDCRTNRKLPKLTTLDIDHIGHWPQCTLTTLTSPIQGDVFFTGDRQTYPQTDIATLWLNQPSGPIQWKQGNWTGWDKYFLYTKHQTPYIMWCHESPNWEDLIHLNCKNVSRSLFMIMVTLNYIRLWNCTTY